MLNWLSSSKDKQRDRESDNCSLPGKKSTPLPVNEIPVDMHVPTHYGAWTSSREVSNCVADKASPVQDQKPDQAAP